MVINTNIQAQTAASNLNASQSMLARSLAQSFFGSRDGRTSSFHLYPLRIRGIDEEKRDAIIQRIFDRDVSVNVHYVPLPRMTFYKAMGYRMEDYPVTYDNFSREISLPVFYGLTDEQVRAVIDAVVASVEEEL